MNLKQLFRRVTGSKAIQTVSKESKGSISNQLCARTRVDQKKRTKRGKAVRKNKGGV